MRSIRLAPITAEILIVCVALYIGCSFQAAASPQRFMEVQRTWHAILNRDFSEVHDGVRRAKEPELNGPFDVWNGDWWRIPVTVFHHSNLLSLVLNLGATWYLGSRLERLWGGFALTMFLGPAICLPVMAELCLGHAYMGLSGLACAMLGALVILRHFDAEAAKAFPEDAAQIGVAIIVVGWLATFSNIISLPNAAHLSGFVYGASIARITREPLRHVIFLRVSIIVVHLWLVPALFLVCHPFWIGSYYWYQAVTTGNPQRAERNLERAIHCDESLVGAWLRWSQVAEERGDRWEAWRRLIQGLRFNPASAPLIDSTRRLWRHLDLGQRRDAELILESFLGKQSATNWLTQIRSGVFSESGKDDEDVILDATPEEAAQFSLEQKVELPTMGGPFDPSNLRNHKIQIDQNDASEGEAL